MNYTFRAKVHGFFAAIGVGCTLVCMAKHERGAELANAAISFVNALIAVGYSQGEKANP